MKTVKKINKKFSCGKILCACNFHLAIGGRCVLTLKDSNLILSTKSTQTTAFSHAAVAF